MSSLKNGLLLFIGAAVIVFPLPIWIDLIKGNQISDSDLTVLLLVIAIAVAAGTYMMMQADAIERIEKRQKG